MANSDPFQVVAKTLETVTITAGSTVNKGYAIAFDKSVADSAGEAVHGIAQNNCASGSQLTIVTEGEAVAIANDTIALGDILATDATGKMVVATDGNTIFARALEAAVADQYFKILITREAAVPIPPPPEEP